MTVTIREALADDLTWVNKQYKQVNFQPSTLQNEYILIAEVNGEKVGVGRLVSLSIAEAELGGMFVAENFRKYGIARKLVDELKKQATSKLVYCLPFKHLEGFYQICGFEPIASCSQVPEPIKAKLNWCSNTYQQATVLLVQQL